MTTDLRLLRGDQVGQGDFVVLVPGSATDALARAGSVFVHREAFAFLETSLCDVWPDYAARSRRRECAVPSEVWLRFRLRNQALREALLSSDQPGAASGVSLLMPELRALAEARQDRMTAGLLQLIDALDAWLAEVLPRSALITIVSL